LILAGAVVIPLTTGKWNYEAKDGSWSFHFGTPEWSFHKRFDYNTGGGEVHFTPATPAPTTPANDGAAAKTGSPSAEAKPNPALPEPERAPSPPSPKPE
jgi:hypothetical protein